MTEQMKVYIETAIADGELEPQEIAFLRRKAAELGDDPDEAEMTAKAELAKLSKQRKQSFEGEIKKCPGCGAVAKSFAAICGDCGYEFRNVSSSENIVVFTALMNELESQRKEDDVENSSSYNLFKFNVKNVLIWWVLWPILLAFVVLRKIFYRKGTQWKAIDSKKEELIINYPVPNTREDIIEFFNLSINRIHPLSVSKKFSKDAQYRGRWNTIWKKKCEQILNKARISLASDPASVQALESQLEKIQIKEKQTSLILGISSAVAVLPIVIVLAVLVFRTPVHEEVDNLINQGYIDDAVELTLKELPRTSAFGTYGGKKETARWTDIVDKLLAINEIEAAKKISSSVGDYYQNSLTRKILSNHMDAGEYREALVLIDSKNYQDVTNDNIFFVVKKNLEDGNDKAVASYMSSFSPKINSYNYSSYAQYISLFLEQGDKQTAMNLYKRITDNYAREKLASIVEGIE